LFIESIELFAGIGVFIAGVLGILRTKIGLWKIPFALFILTGLFMTMGAGLSIVQAVGGTSGIDHFVSYVLSVGRILLILTIAHLMYMLTMLYDKSHLDVVMLSRKGFRDISKRLKKMYGNLGARQVLYSMGEEADYDQLRRTLENWNASEEKFLRWLLFSDGVPNSRWKNMIPEGRSCSAQRTTSRLFLAGLGGGITAISPGVFLQVLVRHSTLRCRANLLRMNASPMGTRTVCSRSGSLPRTRSRRSQ
jgi:hypothetical protein